MYRSITVDCQSRNKSGKNNEKYGCESCIVYHNCTMRNNNGQRQKDSAQYYENDSSSGK